MQWQVIKKKVDKRQRDGGMQLVCASISPNVSGGSLWRLPCDDFRVPCGGSVDSGKDGGTAGSTSATTEKMTSLQAFQ